MRTPTTLFLALAGSPLVAQVSGGDLFFDGADDLFLDSIYPAGCWQVGHPNKPVFTSAYSEPNALVTDTLLPHTDSTTCYAQFTMVADESGVLGKWIDFRYWSDMDSLQSFGWIEKQNSYNGDWNRLPLSDAYYIWFEASGELWTDSGAVFTGRTFGWHDARIYIECMGVLMEENMDRGGGWSDTMRLRFTFRGAANANGRDGWMIDDLHATPVLCSGGTTEATAPSFQLFPDPADNYIVLRAEGVALDEPTVEMLRADGVLIARHRWPPSATMTIRTDHLPAGMYLIRSTNLGLSSSTRVIVQH